jgi:hypothetical protein
MAMAMAIEDNRSDNRSDNRWGNWHFLLQG